MQITLPTTLVLALRNEYPGCLPDADSMEVLVEQVLWNHLRATRRARHTIAEHAPVTVPDEATCAGFGA